MNELDYIGIFNGLNEAEVRYVVCGGVAVNLYGIPRMTYDIDLLLDMSEDNLKKFLGLLRTWGFRPRLPVRWDSFLNPKDRKEWVEKKNMKAFSFHNPDWAISEIDVILSSPIGYEQAKPRIVWKKIGGVDVPIISTEDLISMKSHTNRRQDEADVRHLKRLLREDANRGKDGI